MAQVSKKRLHPVKQEKMMNLLFLAFSDIQNKKEAGKVLKDLLTETERTVLAKRLACFYLLERKTELDRIEETLKLSRSTAFYFRSIYKDSQNLQKFIKKTSMIDRIKELIEDVFVEVLRGTLKKGSNWKEDKRLYYEHKRRRSEKF